MPHPVDGGQRQGRSDEDFAPLRERRTGRDRQALVLLSLGDQLERHRDFSLDLAHVAQIVPGQEIGSDRRGLASSYGSRQSRRAA